MTRTKTWALAALAAASLAGCNERAAKTAAPATAPVAAAPTPVGQPLSAVLAAGRPGLTAVATNTGLSAVLEGVGPYTVLAPPEASLKSSGGVDFTAPAARTEGAALLRAHILPGALTRADIAAAVDRSGGKGAQMRTMAGDLVTFTRDEEGLVVTTADGSRARLAGAETVASNGMLQPLDGLLLKPAR